MNDATMVETVWFEGVRLLGTRAFLLLDGLQRAIRVVHRIWSWRVTMDCPNMMVNDAIATEVRSTAMTLR